jgi:hypothetical protein
MGSGCAAGRGALADKDPVTRRCMAPPPPASPCGGGVATESAPTSRPASRLAPACHMAASAIMAPLIRRAMAIGGSGGCEYCGAAYPIHSYPVASNSYDGGCNRSC